VAEGPTNTFVFKCFMIWDYTALIVLSERSLEKSVIGRDRSDACNRGERCSKKKRRSRTGDIERLREISRHPDCQKGDRREKKKIVEGKRSFEGKEGEKRQIHIPEREIQGVKSCVGRNLRSQKKEKRQVVEKGEGWI